jgi:hypothetical protein
MEKRYQVFVSSTFADLIDERRAVMQALLELNCIPAGMELFPASTDDQWTLIQRVIDDCDYYLVIVGGRYGSMDAQGISYTEKEYDYAIGQGKPAMGFVHGRPGDIPARNVDRDALAAAKLEAFRSKVRRRMCKFWTTADELGGAVSRSYVQILKTHPAEGWVKYRYAKTTEDLEKINQMHEEIRILKEEVARLRESDGRVPSNLARGEDPVRLEYAPGWNADSKDTREVEVTWNRIFEVVGRRCMNLPAQPEVEEQVNAWLSGEIADIGSEQDRVAITRKSFQAIKVQFYALGLIRMEMLMRPGDSFYGADGSPGIGSPQPTLCWVLTDAGRATLAELVAEKRPASAIPKNA